MGFLLISLLQSMAWASVLGYVVHKLAKPRSPAQHAATGTRRCKTPWPQRSDALQRM